MRKFIASIPLFISLLSHSQNNSYTKAWQFLNANKRTEAETLLQSALSEPNQFKDAYITNIYLKSFSGKEDNITDFFDAFYKKADNPYPYVYALWFNSAVLGQNGKKTVNHQLKLLDNLIDDEKTPGTLIAAANYRKGLHYIFSNSFDKAQKSYDEIGNIRNWQYAGPFENISESGFFKDYGPLSHPEPSATFTSLTNAEVKWITPPSESNDGWIPLCYQFNVQTAITYAQTFVTAPSDMTVYCNAGATGSLKIWINDELIISEAKERVTEFDTYTTKYELKKGVNRILVQLGFTGSTYPNFTIRLTDEKFRAIPNLKGSTTFTSYNKQSALANKKELVTHFAESFFIDKITTEPDNLLNYLLLTDVYLRNKKIIEARNIITTAIEKAPENSMLKIKMIEVLLKEENRTLLLEEIEKIKQADSESLLVLDLKIKELFDSQKYDDGSIELEKRIKLYGEDETTSWYKINLLSYNNKYDELVKEAEKLYTIYPENVQLVDLMYIIKKDVYKDKKAAIKVYESFMKNNYNYGIYKKYTEILAEQGEFEKALVVKKKMAESFPYSPDGYFDLAKYFYTTKEFTKAEEYIKKAIALSPYNEQYWEHNGDIKSEQKNTEAALAAYNNSLYFDPNQYTVIDKLRKLNNKPELYKLFTESDINKIIKEDKIENAKNTDYGYYYILDQKEVILHPKGACEEYLTMLIRITNEKGVDRYKESSISYNNSQSLLIEKAEIIKKNQSRIEGERNGNEIVFTNLEVGDVVVFKYKLNNYTYGRFAKEFWDKFYFGSQIYTSINRYSLLAPKQLKLNYVFNNHSLKPAIKPIEDFSLYTWEIHDLDPVKEESLLPSITDIGATLHISTISSWNDISNWYSDVCNNEAEKDFEIIGLYQKLFPESQKNKTQFEKAKIIYNYIQSNIRYSSVSFRQSAYVPQRPSTTLTTRLGDCKDLSSLFVTLSKMAGITAQMVLVDTRDNGEKDILLPSIEFNHCIVKALLDNKEYFIELTDNYLPFGSLPNNLLNAIILEIPLRTSTHSSEAKLLKTSTRTKDVVKREIDIIPSESDLNIKVKTIKYGSLSSSTRYDYLNLDYDKQLKDLEKVIANSYKNNVKMDKVSFIDLEKLNDSVVYHYNYKVKNEISEIGAIKTFRITYPDIIASLDNFTSDERIYPIDYWSYENTDAYETIVNITAPTGTKFIELPTSETLSFKDMKFTLQYVLKSPNKLTIIRKFSNTRNNISASDYIGFKSFFEKIVKAEQKLIAFK